MGNGDIRDVRDVVASAERERTARLVSLVAGVHVLHPSLFPLALSTAHEPPLGEFGADDCQYRDG